MTSASIRQALRAVTIMPAWQNKVEDRIGSIEVGKLADFTIMDKDVFEVAETAPRTIADLRVAATIVGDKVVHRMSARRRASSSAASAPRMISPR